MPACYSCGTRAGPHFLFGAGIYLCDSCKGDRYKVNKAINMSNLITQMELTTTKKLGLMREFYFMSYNAQNSQVGINLLEQIAQQRTLVNDLEGKLMILRAER